MTFLIQLQPRRGILDNFMDTFGMTCRTIQLKTRSIYRIYLHTFILLQSVFFSYKLTLEPSGLMPLSVCLDRPQRNYMSAGNNRISNPSIRTAKELTSYILPSSSKLTYKLNGKSVVSDFKRKTNIQIVGYPCY